MARIVPALVCWLLALSAESAAGQTKGMPTATFVTQSWRVPDGLPQDSVWAIAQTPDGYIWVGTGGGLARFDGVQFRVFGLAEGLPALHVRVLLVDRTGALWVGTANGVARLHGGQVENFAREGLPAANITSLAEDREGAIWIGTTSGLLRWHKGKFDVPDVSMSSVRLLGLDPQGALCVAGTSDGLLRWDGKALRPAAEFSAVRNSRPYRLVTDASGRLWVAGNGGLFCSTAGDWRSYGPDQGLPKVPILCLAARGDGSVWAGSQDEGLYQLRLGSASFERIELGDQGVEAVRAVCEDREGNLWIGTREGGLIRLRPGNATTWEILDDARPCLPFSMAEWSDSFVVSSVGRGLYRVQADGSNEPFFRTELQASGQQTGAVFGDRDKRLWFAAGSGVFMIQGDSLQRVVGRGGATSFCQDTKGTVWIGNGGGVLRKFSDGQLVNVRANLPAAALTWLAADPKGGIWVGIYGHGIVHLQGNSRRSISKAQGLASDLVRALYCDRSGVLWVGSEGGGLSRVQDDQVLNFGKQEGLPTDTILQIVEDDEGSLWLGSYQGVIRVNRRQLDSVAGGTSPKLYARVFGRADGMRSAQCMSAFGGAMKLRDGRLCFATGGGLVVFDPKDHRQSSPAPPVRIEEVAADRRVLSLSPEWLRAKDQREAAPWRLEIAPGPRRFQIAYTAPAFGAPEQVRFRHRLAGLDEDWVDAGTARSVEYSYLRPGRYRFEVTAESGSGVWANPPVALDIELKPFFWQATWFKLVAALALVGVAVASVLGFERRRAREQLRRLEMESHMERERSRIARDIHDDLGSRITKISMITEQAMSRASGGPLVGPMQSISETARDMLDRLDETVWVVNPRNDQLDRLCDYLLNYAQEFFQHTNIRCRFKVQEDLPPLPVAAETRHHIFLIIKEALNNVARHSGASEVRIHLQFSGKRLSLAITDNGRGFDTATCLGLGRGLENMRSRVANLGGSFELFSQPGGGSTVRMQFEVEATAKPNVLP